MNQMNLSSLSLLRFRHVCHGGVSAFGAMFRPHNHNTTFLTNDACVEKQKCSTRAEEFLGPNGFEAVQVAPVTEHILGYQWWVPRRCPEILLIHTRTPCPDA